MCVLWLSTVCLSWPLDPGGTSSQLATQELGIGLQGQDGVHCIPVTGGHWEAGIQALQGMGCVEQSISSHGMLQSSDLL